MTESQNVLNHACRLHQRSTMLLRALKEHHGLLATSIAAMELERELKDSAAVFLKAVESEMNHAHDQGTGGSGEVPRGDRLVHPKPHLLREGSHV